MEKVAHIPALIDNNSYLRKSRENLAVIKERLTKTGGGIRVIDSNSSRDDKELSELENVIP